jgi:hypothetical protein
VSGDYVAKMPMHARIPTFAGAAHQKMIVLAYPIKSLEIELLKGKSRSKTHNFQRKTKAFSIRNPLLTQRKVSNGVSPLCSAGKVSVRPARKRRKKFAALRRRLRAKSWCRASESKSLGSNNTRETRVRPPSENAVRHLL